MTESTEGRLRFHRGAAPRIDEFGHHYHSHVKSPVVDSTDVALEAYTRDCLQKLRALRKRVAKARYDEHLMQERRLAKLEAYDAAILVLLDVHRRTTGKAIEDDHDHPRDR